MERAKRPCAKFRCSGLASPPERWCEHHKEYGQQQTREADRARGSAAARGYGHRWRVVRAVVMKRDRHLCQLCHRDGIVKVADDVHHIKPATEFPELFFVQSNLIALCHECNQREDARRRAGLPGRVVAPDIAPVTGGFF